jgi:hypothetical protein
VVPLKVANEAPGSGRAFHASSVARSTETLNITPEESTRHGTAVLYRNNGARLSWREPLEKRREQLRNAASAQQPALFELRNDSKPEHERAA